MSCYNKQAYLISGKIKKEIQTVAATWCKSNLVILEKRFQGLKNNLQDLVDNCKGIASKLYSFFRRHGVSVSADIFAELLKKSATKSLESNELKLSKGDNIQCQSSAVLQLRYLGPSLGRAAGVQDSRVKNFLPDEWQIKLLNAVDQRKSVIVMAPTSAGKTFICYYAMKKVLRESDDGIVVYVAPTKPLVNQVVAEVSSRFRKEYSGSMNMLGWFHRDNRSDNIDRCQILVTVPQCAEILFMGSHPNSWNQRVRCIILDEIHNISSEDGATWERLILLTSCPIIALSATIGNVETFHRWLSSTRQDTKTIDSTTTVNPNKATSAKNTKAAKQEAQAAKKKQRQEQVLAKSNKKKRQDSLTEHQQEQEDDSNQEGVRLIVHNERYNDLSYWVWNGIDIEKFHPVCVLRSLLGVTEKTPESFPTLNPEESLQVHLSFLLICGMIS